MFLQHGPNKKLLEEQKNLGQPCSTNNVILCPVYCLNIMQCEIDAFIAKINEGAAKSTC